MILMQIKDYIQANGKVSAAQIQHHFKLEVDFLAAMLEHLVNHGCVKQSVCDSCTKSCSTCPISKLTFYQTS